MEFKFAKTTEVTELAFRVNKDYKNSGYTRIFICPDVTDYHLLRILPNYDDEYNHDENCIMIEHEMIPKSRGEDLTIQKVKRILEDDDFGNWDYKSYRNRDIDSLIKSEIDQGFGILS